MAAVEPPYFASVFETSFITKQAKLQSINLRELGKENGCSCIRDISQQRKNESSETMVTPLSSSLIHCPYSGAIVYFPKDTVYHNMSITMQVLDFDSRSCCKCTEQDIHPASQILTMGPNRSSFKKSLYIAFPLKNDDYNNKDYNLLIRYSETDIDEAPKWKHINCTHIVFNEIPYAVFSVNHFTIFQAVWEKVTHNLQPVLNLLPKRMNDFDKKSVCFKAFMTEISETNQFGIMIVCITGDSDFKTPRYYHNEIGMSMNRQLIPGKVVIRLKSSFFKGDDDIDEILEKTVRFTGDAFDAQFACQLKGSLPDVCLFGQVQINSQCNSSTAETTSFNLMKVKSSRSVKVKSIMNQVESDILEKLAEEIGASKELLCDALTLLSTNTGLKKIEIDPSLDGLYKMLSLEKNCEKESELIEAESTSIVHNEADSTTSPLSKENNYSSVEGSCLQSPRQGCRKRKRELPDNGECLDESSCLDIASGIIHAWKFIGRHLGLSEQHLIEIELDCRYDNEQEKSFQMLMAWKQAFPDHCNTKTLGIALRKCRLNYSASRLAYY